MSPRLVIALIRARATRWFRVEAFREAQEWRQGAYRDPDVKALGALGLRWREVKGLPVEDTCAVISFLMSDGTFGKDAALAWLRTQDGSLGRTPLEALREGRVEAVIRAAERLLRPVII